MLFFLIVTSKLKLIVGISTSHNDYTSLLGSTNFRHTHLKDRLLRGQELPELYIRIIHVNTAAPKPRAANNV